MTLLALMRFRTRQDAWKFWRIVAMLFSALIAPFSPQMNCGLRQQTRSNVLFRLL
jgi:hypothetical protein